MQIASLDEARSALVRLVADWKAGAFESPWYLQDTAEEIEHQLGERGLLPTDNPERVDVALVAAALDLLTNAQAQFVLPRDIPAFEALLDSEPAAEGTAVERFRNYWNDIDYDARQAQMERYWLGGRPA